MIILSWRTGVDVYGAGERDGGARLDKHRALSVDHSSSSWRGGRGREVERQADVGGELEVTKITRRN